MSANKTPTKNGGIRLVHMLTELGGIESEMTITRFAPDRFYLNSAIMGQSHDLDWLRQHIDDGEEVIVTDLTDSLGLLGVTGPRARDLLAGITDTDLSNEAFRWLTAQEIDVAGVPCKALRVSYVGELGWELHHPMDRMAELYEAIVAAGERYGLVHFGSYAMDVMRIEKGYKAWGNELTTEITPVEAVLGRFVDYGGDFIGKAATVARRDQADQLAMILVYCEVDVDDCDCRGNEPVMDGDRVMGITTSGTWGHTVGRSLAFAYVDPAFADAGTKFEILIMDERRTATVLSEPAYDPTNEALRA